MPGSAIRRAVSTARSVRAVIARPPYATPGHFYSPLTAESDISRALSWTQAPGVDLAPERQLALAARLRPLLAEPTPGPRYVASNAMFGPADAAVYRAMLTHLRPARVLEVGSGFSTAVALDEADANPALAGLEITCIEPYPERLLGLIQASDHAASDHAASDHAASGHAASDHAASGHAASGHGRLTLVRQPVQDVDPAVFGRLGAGDVLFVDSTHVVKAGSDVVWLFLHVLPRLAAGVVVHVHDVFWPFEYPAPWLRQRRDWTEAYLLHAFLAGNTSWEILLFSSWLWRCQPELIPEQLAGAEPGSLWIRKVS